MGDVQLSRDVGQALATNPFAIVVPCHRILAAGNKPGGFSALGGPDLKLKMLEIEKAYVNHTPSLFDFAEAPRERSPQGVKCLHRLAFSPTVPIVRGRYLYIHVIACICN